MGPTRALLRALRAIDAVPVEMTSDGIEIDTDGRGKSRLPVARIEAIAVAAVRGLGPRPVLVVDCILNWRDDIASPLKLIRFRSDRFDAASVGAAAAGTSPVAALGAWASGLQRSVGGRLPPVGSAPHRQLRELRHPRDLRAGSARRGARHPRLMRRPDTPARRDATRRAVPAEPG
jgi:hypothetical protein